MTRSQPHWSCMDQCGACCRLAPDERPEAVEALNPLQQQQYLSMVGDDGWCIHFDSGSRRCLIYDSRPEFCRVSSLCGLFGIEPDQIADFVRFCLAWRLYAYFCQPKIKKTKKKPTLDIVFVGGPYAWRRDVCCGHHGCFLTEEGRGNPSR